MSVEQNKAVVRRFHEELFNQQNLAIAEEILHEDVAYYSADGTQRVSGRDQYVSWVRRCLEVLPDYKITYYDMIGEGDLVAFRWVVRATHRGGEDWIFGAVSKDTPIVWFGVDIFHLSQGKIVRYYPSARHRFGE